MKMCPVCHVALSQMLLEKKLPAYRCPRCEGIWIASNEYLAWLRSQPASMVDDIMIDDVLPLPVVDNRQAILCPECGHFLRRFKIWPDITFHVERCGGCNGIWFDRNEWDVLKHHNLHSSVTGFFTDAWQQKLRHEEMRRRFEKMYRQKFGVEDYHKIKELRSWVSNHPQGGGLLAYLTDPDPYKG